MIRSKIIPILVAAFCGLALQFHFSAANAQTCTPEFGQVGGIYNNNVTPGCYLFPGNQICSPYMGNCLVMESESLYLYSGYDGSQLWSSDTNNASLDAANNNPSLFGNVMQFLPNGDMQIVASTCTAPTGCNPYFDTGTQQGGYEDWSGYQGYFLTVTDDGNVIIYDSYLNPIWEASYDSSYNWGEASLVQQACGC